MNHQKAKTRSTIRKHRAMNNPHDEMRCEAIKKQSDETNDNEAVRRLTAKNRKHSTDPQQLVTCEGF